jgi:2-methylcitrate dehydratase PrpD
VVWSFTIFEISNKKDSPSAAGTPACIPTQDIPMRNVTQTLSRYVTSSTYADLPQPIRREGIRAFVNFVGCAAGGSQEDDVERMVQMLIDFNGAAEAIVVGRRERLDALNAAFINSMSSSALAFNDTHFATAAHPTSPVAAALLALAERQPMSGKEFIHALILGIEVQCRVGNILSVAPAESAVGLSMQGIVGPIGAGVAAGRILGFDEQQMTTAIGLAANQASGLRQAQSTMASHFTPGHAARCGLLAAMLAARGFECSDSMLEGPKGFAVSYGRNANAEVAIDKLGADFEISTLAYKPYPSGFVIHPIIEACLEIVRTHSFDAEEIQRIELTTNPLTVKLTDVVDPKDRGQALVSFQHWAAATLLYKAAGLAQVSDAIVTDVRVRALRHKVTYVTAEALGRDAASVRVVLKDGTAMEASVQQCRGSPGQPLTDEDLTQKTRAQLRTVYAAGAAEEILTQCWRMEELSGIDTFCRQLADGLSEGSAAQHAL